MTCCFFIVVIGFEAEHYTLNEQHGSQQVTIEVLSSPSSLQTNVTMQVIALPGNATGAYNYYTAWETLCHNMILNVLIFFLQTLVTIHCLSVKSPLLPATHVSISPSTSSVMVWYWRVWKCSHYSCSGQRASQSLMSVMLRYPS